ncbi:MAG TPA: methionine synthase [Planctomycetota bacterium]|nr:methionine synthase [Planctomycetota bacterium]
MDLRSIYAHFPDRSKRLVDLLQERILVVDGAMGTQIQGKNLNKAEHNWDKDDNCNEELNTLQPKVIQSIHEAYLAAGCDIVETNTFGSTPIVLEDYALGAKAREITAAGVRNARAACDKFTTPTRLRFVAGSMGPTTKSATVTGNISFDELVKNFAVQIQGFVDGGADCLLFETCLETLHYKAASIAADQVFAERGLMLPIMVSVTIEAMGTMLGGQDIEAAWVSFQHRPLLSFGMNCSTGPDTMADHVRTLAKYCDTATSCIPNAGLPDETLKYNLTPAQFANKLTEFVDNGWLNIVGGCCGTTPEHIALLVKQIAGKKPRTPQPIARTVFSGMDAIECTADNRPIFIGERTNSLGSREFKKLIATGKYEEASEIGRKQVRAGAHVLDVCLQNPDRDEIADITQFLDLLIKKVKVPLMIDSTDDKVLAVSLKKIQGKAIYNSVNLEDGEERFKKIVPLAKAYGCALIVGCIDEDKDNGMAVTRQRKLEVAQRSYKLLTEKYGMSPYDLIFDPLVFPCGTGDAKYVGSARETIEGVRLIHEHLPLCKTTLGISNVSFGLPPAGREVLNSVFLYHCIQAGLDMPIVNTQKLVRYPQIPEADRKICEDLIDNKGADPVAAFAAHFRERKASTEAASDRSKLPIKERLARGIVEGTKEGLIDDLNTLMREMKPLDIINGPLMAGMDEVGRLFNNNELIVAEVLQSAEVMKAAVAHLEPFMDKADVSVRGTMVIGTVKGDVHDIGKSLVDIIFSNNGYSVIDLGIKVLPETLIDAARKNKATLIGLSGLLVKSAQQMVVTVADFKSAGLKTPVLVGGAALSQNFTRTQIAPAYGELVAYAKDAMNGLDLANQIVDPTRRDTLIATLAAGDTKRAADKAAVAANTAAAVAAGAKSAPAASRVVIEHNFPAPTPPDLKLHVLNDYSVEEIYSYVNPAMLFGKHLGLKGSLDRLLAQNDPKAIELKTNVDKLVDTIIADKLLRPQAVYRYFPALSEGDKLTLYKGLPKDHQHGDTCACNLAAQFHFPRQSNDKGWCLSDFVRAKTQPRQENADYVAMFVVTCGEGVRARAEEYKKAGRFFESIALQAIAIECAEGFAELLHRKIRAAWGFPDPAELTMQQRLQGHYRGVRVSFGYPACPRLEDQTILFNALEVSKNIAVNLTEEYMMDPEATVSAVVFHHPQAKYFAINPDDLARFEAGK